MINKSVIDSEPAGGLMPLVALLERVVGFVMKLTIAISATGVLACLSLITYSVVMRYGFNDPPGWVDDTVGLILVVIVMFAAAPTLREGGHISVDMLTGMLATPARRWAAGWATVSVLIVAGVFVVNGWDIAMSSRMFGVVTSGNVEIPVYLPQLMIPLGGSLMLLVGIEALIRHIAGAPSLAHEGHHGEEQQ